MCLTFISVIEIIYLKKGKGNSGQPRKAFWDQTGARAAQNGSSPSCLPAFRLQHGQRQTCELPEIWPWAPLSLAGNTEVAADPSSHQVRMLRAGSCLRARVTMVTNGSQVNKCTSTLERKPACECNTSAAALSAPCWDSFGPLCGQKWPLSLHHTDWVCRGAPAPAGHGANRSSAPHQLRVKPCRGETWKPRKMKSGDTRSQRKASISKNNLRGPLSPKCHQKPHGVCHPHSPSQLLLLDFKLSLFWSSSEKIPLALPAPPGQIPRNSWQECSEEFVLVQVGHRSPLYCVTAVPGPGTAFTAPCAPLECPLWDVFWNFPWAASISTQQMSIFWSTISSLHIFTPDLHMAHPVKLPDTWHEHCKEREIAIDRYRCRYRYRLDRW